MLVVVGSGPMVWLVADVVVRDDAGVCYTLRVGLLAGNTRYSGELS